MIKKTLTGINKVIGAAENVGQLLSKDDTLSEKQLYEQYASWTSKLHTWLGQLGRHLDVEFLPDQYVMRLYTGYAQERNMSWGITVPGLDRPPHEASFSLSLPRAEDNPTPAELDDLFRELCLGAARILEIDLDKPKLKASTHEKSSEKPTPQPQQRLVKDCPRKRLRPPRRGR